MGIIEERRHRETVFNFDERQSGGNTI